jgi:hypothetical protein
MKLSYLVQCVAVLNNGLFMDNEWNDHLYCINYYINMKFQIGIAVCIVLSGCVSSRIKQSRKLMREYAFCACAQIISNDSTLFRNDLSNAIYFDIAGYNFSSYKKVDSAAKAFSILAEPSNISDYENKKAVFLNCFEFYHSRQLKALIKKLDKDINSSW